MENPTQSSRASAAAHHRRISVTGLGYVGLQVAVAFARSGVPVVAFDIDQGRVAHLQQGIDRTGELPAGTLRMPNLLFSSAAESLRQADFHIVAVPTPLTAARKPNLEPLLTSARMVGGQLKRDDIVVFESTVYPGATEEDCVPVMEWESGLVCGRDFNVAYSPERVNPGDPLHRFETITKIIAAQNESTLRVLQQVYGSVVEADLHVAPDIHCGGGEGDRKHPARPQYRAHERACDDMRSTRSRYSRRPGGGGDQVEFPAVLARPGRRPLRRRRSIFISPTAPSAPATTRRSFSPVGGSTTAWACGLPGRPSSSCCATAAGGTSPCSA